MSIKQDVDKLKRYNKRCACHTYNIKASSVYNEELPLEGWEKPQNPKKGSTAVVYFTDGTIAYYSYFGEWVYDFALPPGGEITEAPYKVCTVLITQNGSDTEDLTINEGNLTIGVTYFIDDPAGGDWTNVGSPNNNPGTYFVATGTTPNSWGDGTLIYNTGAPIVNVLDNTLGNIWWIYNGVGTYSFNSDCLFTFDKTAIIVDPEIAANYEVYIEKCANGNMEGLVDTDFYNKFFEIRVYL